MIIYKEPNTLRDYTQICKNTFGIKELRKNRMLNILVVDTFVTNLREYREHKKDRPARPKRRRRRSSFNGNRFFTRRHYWCANSHWMFLIKKKR